MLKYEVNYRDLRTDFVDVPILYHDIEDDPDDASILVVTCYYDGDVDLRPETPLSITSYYDIDTEISGDEHSVAIEISPVIAELNKNYRYFSFYIPKYYTLDINEIQTVVENNTVYLHFVFNGYHYFRSWDESITFYVRFIGQDGILYEKVFEGCEFQDEYTLSWHYDNNSPLVNEFMCSVFRNDSYTFVGYDGNSDSVTVDNIPSSACFTDEVYIKKLANDECQDFYEYYEKECKDGDVSGLSVYRDQFISDFSVAARIGGIKLTLPFSQCYDVRLQQEDCILNGFVRDELNASINKVTEMEKYVYHPVFRTDVNSFSTEDIYKIKFNLHFRQREGDTWSVIDDGFWNGVDNEVIQLDSGMDSPSGVRFFSYSDRSKQSDLLKYIGFTNKDIKFQKNKLKKSFLRLSFYDSDNPARQNLLSYSLVYMDGGKLFAKYMNNIGTVGYAVSEGDGNNNLVGAAVDREYVPDGYSGMSDDDLEEHRLSSQFVIGGVYDSKASSEGYNLYLWADNDTTLPSDLYMKVEFNHAGYGRTIPFMMPYYVFTDDGRYGVKTFGEIVDDWKNGNGYGIKKYMKYSYIHLKYGYDKANGRRVYYLDPETYGDDALYGKPANADSSPNELELNLYEAKVNF